MITDLNIQSRQVVPCIFHAESHHVTGRLPEGKGPSPVGTSHDTKKFTEIAVFVSLLKKSSLGLRVTILPSGIRAKLADGSTVPAIGTIFTINTSQSPYTQNWQPTILTGMSVDKDALGLPGGCSGLYLTGYKGPISDLSGTSEICFAIAFLAEFCNTIQSIELSNSADQ